MCWKAQCGYNQSKCQRQSSARGLGRWSSVGEGICISLQVSRGFGCGKGRVFNSNYSSAFICGVCLQYQVAATMSDAIGICMSWLLRLVAMSACVVRWPRPFWTLASSIVFLFAYSRDDCLQCQVATAMTRFLSLRSVAMSACIVKWPRGCWIIFLIIFKFP